MNITLPGSEYSGRVIDGKFTLLRWLGGGEHSSVFLTELAGNPPQNAAIKFVSADDAGSARWAAARLLSHAHLVRLFDFGRCELDGNELDYVVTEYAEEVLSEVEAERPLTAAEAGEMLPAVVDALEYLHARGLVHGGLAPSNILAVGDLLKLSVDGVQEAGEQWRGNRPLNKYDAPEMATDKMSPAMDVWSLGIVLVKALTRETPDWYGASGGDPVVPGSVAEPFAAIARDCLRVDPARRCTLAAIRARLEPVAAAYTAAPPTPAPAANAVRKPVERPAAVPIAKPITKPITAPAVESVATSAEKPRLRAFFAIATAAVLIAVLVMAVMMTRSHHQGPPAPAATTQVAEMAPGGGSTVNGSVTHEVMPDVPRPAMESIHGSFKVEISVEVDPSGDVSNAAIESQGPSRYFAGFALKAAREWKFRPAEKDGRAVASTWKLAFEFRRDGAEVTPVETRP